jgi:serine/threonine-protein kinase
MRVDIAARIAARVADTVAAAHQAGVIHRDLKPENVFLQRHHHRPDLLSIKVLDFGFAKVAADMLAPKTQYGVLLGTPAYMAPEQCLGLAPIDVRSDVYALGCILYEMVVGRPTRSGTMSQVRNSLRYKPVAPPRCFVRDLSIELDTLIMRMIAREPSQRPATMAEVARALEQIGLRRAFRPRAAGTGPLAALPEPAAQNRK